MQGATILWQFFFANSSISGLQIIIEYTQLTLQMIFLRRQVGAPNI